MKTRKTTVLYVFFLLLVAGCGQGVKDKALYDASKAAIEAHVKADAVNPESIQMELTSDLIRLDTIADPELFQTAREYLGVVGQLKGLNTYQEPIENEVVFYVSSEGRYIDNRFLEELSEKERQWLKAHAF